MQIKVNKHSVYAPLRYEATRPYAVTLGKAFVSQANKGERQRMAYIRDALPSALSTAIGRLTRAPHPAALQTEHQCIQVFGSYYQSGRIIFDVQKPLTAALLLTDVEDIPCSELVFPVDSFYLHFGEVSELLIDGFAVEGAFVHRHSDILSVDLVQRGFGHPQFYTLAQGESLLGVSVDLSDQSKTVVQALTDSVAAIVQQNAESLAQVEALMRQLEEQYGQSVRVPFAGEHLTQQLPVLKRAMALIINALFYIAAEPNDVQEEWGSDTPASVIEALKIAKSPGQIRTLENTLKNAQYTKVKVVGKVFSTSIESRAIEEALGTGRHLATHFRRGHFRQQAYGPERSLRKRIFVAPVVVNASNAGETPGRIYEMQ